MIIQKTFSESFWKKLKALAPEVIDVPYGETVPEIAEGNVAVRDWISIFWQRYFILPLEIWENLLEQFD